MTPEGAEPTFDEMYAGEPAWDIGAPQPAFVALAEAGRVRGSVLDVGCGTGENALYLAARGHLTWGVDLSSVAIARARAKAQARGLGVTFRVADALALGALGRRFDTIIDSGLFHAFSDDEWTRFAPSIADALAPGGAYHMLFFSDDETDEQGPRRVARAEIEAVFARGFRIDEIVPARFAHRRHAHGARAWLASITRV